MRLPSSWRVIIVGGMPAFRDDALRAS